MEFNTRKDAKLAGVKTYNTGKVCSNGHLSYRYTQSGSCAECINGAPVTIELTDAQTKAAKLRALADQIEAEAKQQEIDNLIFEEKKRAAYELRLKELRENNARRDFLKLCKEKQAASKKERRELVAEHKAAERTRKLNEKQYKLNASASRKAALKTFIKFKEPVHITNVLNAKSLLMAYAIMRCEHVRESDLWIDFIPRHGFVYTLRAHPADVPAIREQLSKWFRETSDLIQAVQKIHDTKLKVYSDKAETAAALENAQAFKIN